MQHPRLKLCGLGLLSILQAQVPTAPVVQPRGVVNAYTQLPAPAVAGQGGLIHIRGINLGPVEGWKAEGLPLPTSFGTPPLQVLINNRPAPMLEATSSRIVAQVPFETPNGLATLIVRRGEQSSRPARIQIQGTAPGIAASNGNGFGAAANGGTDGSMKLRASSLGQTDPTARSGEVAEGAVARAAIRVFVGGMAAEATATMSPTRPGEFILDVKTPEGAKPGDSILVGVNAGEANILTMDRGKRESEISYIPYPAGTPELRNIRSSDVNGMFLNANAVRGADSCYPAFTVDARKLAIAKVEGCLTTAQAQAPTPFIDGISAPYFASFEGPFTGTPQPGQPTLVSDKIRIFTPGAAESKLVTLPEPVANITSQAGGGFVANAPGKAFRIDAQTAEVQEVTGGGGGGAQQVSLQALLQRFQNVDLGDGINRLLSPVMPLQNQFVLTAGDDIGNPTKARVAVVSAQGEITAQRNFPEGWLPIVAPAPPLPPGAQQPPQNLQQLRTPTPVYMDAQTRNYYVAARNSEGKHGWAYFPPEGDAQLIALPDGLFFTACTANIPIFNLELTRAVALMAASTDDRAFKNPCPAEGFVLFDLAARRFQAIGLPGSGKFNATGGADEINDFLVGSNFDPATRNTSDTFYALDGANGTPFRFDLPTGVNGFSGTNPVPSLNLVIASANNRIAGDAGVVLFDLERTEARLLPTPEGFATVNVLGVLPSIRRLIGRGVRAGNAGTQILVYNLETGDLEVVPNPEGIAWIGSPIQQAQPGQAGQPGQAVVNILPRINRKANTVEAIAFGEDRRQKGVIVIRVN